MVVEKNVTNVTVAFTASCEKGLSSNAEPPNGVT